MEAIVGGVGGTDGSFDVLEFGSVAGDAEGFVTEVIEAAAAGVFLVGSGVYLDGDRGSR